MSQPVDCSICGKFIWGLTKNQQKAFFCDMCEWSVHKKCMKKETLCVGEIDPREIGGGECDITVIEVMDDVKKLKKISKRASKRSSKRESKKESKKSARKFSTSKKKRKSESSSLDGKRKVKDREGLLRSGGISGSHASFGSEFGSFGSYDGLLLKTEATLDLEIYNFEQFFGKNRISLVPFFDEWYVEISVFPDELLDRNVSSAWGILDETPIVIRLHMWDLEMVHIPEIMIYQMNESGSKYTRGALSQLDRIIQNFTKETWDITYSSSFVEDAEYDTEVKYFDKSMTEVASVFYENENDLDSDIEIDLLTEMVMMGFDRKQSQKALLMTQNNLEEAISKILLNEIVIEIKTEQNIKVEPDRMIMRYGFLSALMSYFIYRIQNLNDYCVICDQTHIFGIGMLKPTVCTRDLCWWSFQDLGVGTDAADGIATGQDVLDMLILFAKAVSSHPSRRQLVFNPFPLIYNPYDMSKMELNPDQPDYPKAMELIRKIPPLDRALKQGIFRQILDDLDPLCYPLYQWIIQSNRSYIVGVPENIRIPSFSNCQQFLLLSAPPEKEKRFQELKKKHGSCFCFHGSGLENWHSIVRNGLVNASGTKLQVNGKAHGAGIYFSPSSVDSRGYSSRSIRNELCLAICEVITEGLNKKTDRIWTHLSQDSVVTRFIILATKSTVMSSKMTTDPNFIKEIQTTMNFYGL